MDTREHFFSSLKNDMEVTLATAAEGRVTMRVVSPVLYENVMLMFTNADSKKYRQLKANPRCCIKAGGFFAEAEAAFCGPTMLPENAPLRAAYCEKFPGAFDEGVAFGGRNSEFVLLRPTLLSGWQFADGESDQDGAPTIPFELPLL